LGSTAAKISSDKLPKETTISGLTGNIALKQWEGTSAVPTLALHGWLDNAASFDRLIPLLKNVSVTAMDLPGHGLSDPKGSGAIYHFIDWLWDVLAVADALQWKEFNLMGHSVGGNIAMALAALVPERVKKLVVLDALGPTTNEPDEVVSQLRKYQAAAAEAGGRKAPVYASVEDVAKTRARYPGRPMEYDSALAICRRGLKPIEGGVTWRSDARLMLPTPLRLTEGHVKALIEAIECPLLIIRAIPGLKPPERYIATRRGYPKNPQIVEVEGGHHVHLDFPERVAPSILSFLN